MLLLLLLQLMMMMMVLLLLWTTVGRFVACDTVYTSHKSTHINNPRTTPQPTVDAAPNVTRFCIDLMGKSPFGGKCADFLYIMDTKFRFKFGVWGG
jgi:hypothetical protein